MVIMVSACLLGTPCRYDGKSKPNEKIIDYLKDKEYIEICPECAGKLPIPRTPCEIIGGDGHDVLSGAAKVCSVDGIDRTSEYLTGAQQVINDALAKKVDFIIFKENSPSCGVNLINDGTFTKTRISGQGVSTALAAEKGIKIFSENMPLP